MVSPVDPRTIADLPRSPLFGWNSITALTLNDARALLRYGGGGSGRERRKHYRCLSYHRNCFCVPCSSRLRVWQMAINELPEPLDREVFSLRATLAVAVLCVLVALYGFYHQRKTAITTRDSAARLTEELRVTQIALEKANMENAALKAVSPPGFLQQYDARIAALKTAADADAEVYDTVKKGKGKKETEVAFALLQTESDLYGATDSLTSFLDRWRVVAGLLNKMLNENITQLESSRNENNLADVRDMTQRVIRDAPDHEARLRAAIDSLKSSALH